MRGQAEVLTAMMYVSKLWKGSSYLDIGKKLNALSDSQIEAEDTEALEQRAREVVQGLAKVAGIRMCKKHPLDI